MHRAQQYQYVSMGEILRQSMQWLQSYRAVECAIFSLTSTVAMLCRHPHANEPPHAHGAADRERQVK